MGKAEIVQKLELEDGAYYEKYSDGTERIRGSDGRIISNNLNPETASRMGSSPRGDNKRHAGMVNAILLARGLDPETCDPSMKALAEMVADGAHYSVKALEYLRRLTGSDDRQPGATHDIKWPAGPLGVFCLIDNTYYLRVDFLSPESRQRILEKVQELRSGFEVSRAQKLKSENENPMYTE
jgi:hypothetical protein